VYISPFPHTCYMTRPSHSFRFDRPKYFGWGVQISKLLIMCSSLHSPLYNLSTYDSITYSFMFVVPYTSRRV
jgi:hypothetical protein